MEMVEEDVVDAVAGEGVHQSTQKSVVRIFDKPLEVPEGGHRGSRDFEHHQRRHQIRHRVAGERNRQPEKRTAHQVKGVGADKV